MAGSSRPGTVPPWQYAFHDLGEVECCLCGGKLRTVIVVDGREQGICEACAVHAYWEWHRMSLDAVTSPPSELSTQPRRLKVLVTSLRVLEGGKQADPGVPESYMVGMATTADGFDLPTVELLPRESTASAVERALASVGLRTWPGFHEGLYVGLSPRSYLVEVVLVTACAKLAADDMKDNEPPPPFKLQWREWPPWDRVPGLASFYLALRHVWPLRLWKHQAREPRTTGITTFLRNGAADYIRMQHKLRLGQADVDTSTAEILRRAMTEDEKLVDRWIREREEREAELREQRSAEAPEVPALEAAGEQLVLPVGEDDAEDAEDGGTDQAEAEDDFDPTKDA